MAEHGATVEFGTATGNDYPAHLRTYESFVHFAKYGTTAIAILLILLAFFLL